MWVKWLILIISIENMKLSHGSKYGPLTFDQLLIFNDIYINHPRREGFETI